MELESCSLRTDLFPKKIEVKKNISSNKGGYVN
jgi:hypothetical protein